ncbi:RNA-binding (RRM/RBD/RNP motif) family protein [Abeliophyllum distichum]|uniref:RNA-binding (RRM/RBD/RNP motif) family protein n=1 Tax=Abeliophyllum distichum TaxID=126358 RepID=A0ABD1R019_9LAMI
MGSNVEQHLLRAMTQYFLIVKLLEKAGIEKIDEVTIKADPNNIENNRGFAFVEFERPKDAQIAFHKLQKKDIFGKDLKMKVEWAQPLIKLAKEEILKVKSVYAEYLPSSWDEENVKDYFKRFGEIENVVLAKDLPASRRKDFAFINYSSSKAALHCIEAVNREKEKDDCSKVKIMVSLANPMARGKQMKHVSNPIGKQISKEKPKASKYFSFYCRGSVAIFVIYLASAVNWYHFFGTSFSCFWEQAAIFSCGMFRKGHDHLYLEPRGLPQARTESYYPISGPSALSTGVGPVGMTSFPYHHQQVPGYVSD